MLRANHIPRVLRTFPFIQYRMYSTSMIHPDRIFNNSPPSPPPWSEPTSSSSNQTWTTSHSLRWKECEDDDRTLKPVLYALQQTLRSVHKHKIIWPVEET